MLMSKLKEALICLKAGRVTLAYPFEPSDPQGNFRGLPKIEVTECIGCGGCASVCHSALIEMLDEEDHITITRYFERCIYCGRCEEICPEGAIEMTQNFENATNDRNDLLVCGPVTNQVLPYFKRLYEAVPNPKLIFAIGSCACGGGIWHNTYNVIGGVDKVVPVDFYIPGCPSRPEAILHGVAVALGLVPKKIAPIEESDVPHELLLSAQ